MTLSMTVTDVRGKLQYGTFFNEYDFAGFKAAIIDLFFQHSRVNSSTRKTHFLAFRTKLKAIFSPKLKSEQLSLNKNCGKNS